MFCEAATDLSPPDRVPAEIFRPTEEFALIYDDFVPTDIRSCDLFTDCDFMPIDFPPIMACDRPTKSS